MNQTTIFLPVMALVGWTLIVLVLIAYHRFRAAFAGRVTVDDFRVGESGNVPESVCIPNRIFMNLLEVPVLFYVVCIVLFVTRNVTSTALILAWSYVGLRVAHSLVYLTYNRVMHRFLAFAVSNFVLVVIWAGLLLALSR